MLTKVFTDSTVPTIIEDLDGVITDLNDEAVAAYGWQREELIGNSIKRLVPEEKHGHSDELLNRCRRGELVQNIEGARIHRDGRQIPVLISMSLLTNETGKELGIATVAQDITERKKAEAERLSLQKRLDQVEKDDSLTRMAGAVAHNFNNMLSVIIGNLELAMLDLAPGANLYKNLADAKQGAQNAAEISHLMLTYIGQTPGKPKPHDLSENCRAALRQMPYDLPMGVRLETDLPVPGPVIICDSGQMNNMFNALFANAIESIEGFSGVIHIEVGKVEAARIREKNRFPKDWKSHAETFAYLKVQDTGCGMDSETIGRIFDPFFTDKFSGRGLGLAMTTGIVKAHGGCITVGSTLGHGSAFQVYMPLSKEEILRDKETIMESPRKIDFSGTVLLVEDQEIVRNVAMALLERLGFNVMIAKGGDEAQALFRSNHENIRLVLTDMSMPGMNGWETLSALRVIQPDIPVILSSGYDETHAMAGNHVEQPQAFLRKPYQLESLKEALEKALKD